MHLISPTRIRSSVAVNVVANAANSRSRSSTIIAASAILATTGVSSRWLLESRRRGSK